MVCDTNTVSDYFAEQIAADSFHPICTVYGWHTQNFYEDILHDDCLGIRQDATASCLKELCEEGAFGAMPGGPWKERYNVCLFIASKRFKAWCRDQRISCSQSRFTVNSLTLSTLDSIPVTKGKARNSVYVSQWLAEFCRDFVSTEHGRQRCTCMHGFMEFWNTVNSSKSRLLVSSEEKLRLQSAREMLLLCYQWLSKESVENGKHSWNMRPKFHRVDKCLRRCIRTGLNPSIFWTFGSEHLMGVMARQCQKIHGSSLYRRSVQRWQIYWWAELLHEIEGR